MDGPADDDQWRYDDLDTIAEHLVDGRLKYRVGRAITERQSPDEVHALLVPVQSLLFARR